MENQNCQERTVPVYVRSSRAFRQFKNPPQPHMCIQDTIKDTAEKLYVNVLGWQKIANPKQYSDPIPLYGGMQVPHGCGPNSNKPPLLVFAVMVNPDILKASGKNATNPSDREALVSLLCDFVEAMNPGLVLARKPVILKDRDLTGELKDVWHAVQNKREREKGMNQDVMYKVYDIDGIGNDDLNEDDKQNSPKSCKSNDGNSSLYRGSNGDKRNVVKSSKQILLNAGQKSEFDSGMNNCQISQNHLKENRCGTINADTTYCTPVYGQIVSTRENHNQINDIQQKFASNEMKPSTSFRKDWNTVHGKTTEGWDEFSKRNISTIKNGDGDLKRQRCFKTEKTKDVTNGKSHYDFFPVFDNKATVNDSTVTINDGIDEQTNKEHARNDDNSKIIIESMQKLVLRTTDNKLCDNKTSAISS
uniref:Odorant receptor 51 n=1 Tax=Streltzoviella insularis TaxID=1206366 RepID=A0A7D5UMQ4_9NEOP|nr:odorant receptor 51 [Streltzoviella insularis]